MGKTPMIQMQSRRIFSKLLAGIALNCTRVLAGPYSPLPGQAGSTAIPADNPNIVEWASGATIIRGLRNVENPTEYSANASSPLNYAFYGGSDGACVAASNASQAAGGPAITSTANTAPIGEPPQPQQTLYGVALGQNGYATLTFNQPITNGPGPDFAVFNNGFSTGSNEWDKPAIVEVSSNGVNFFAFPSVSLTQTTTQIGNFGELDPTNLYDLAGNFPAGYGTPFDLSELAGVSPLLNVNDVTQVRIVSVTGDINPAYATRDSTGNIINSPWPAPSSAGSEGFILAGVGVLNSLNTFPSTAITTGTQHVNSTDMLPANTALTIYSGAQLIADPGAGLLVLSSLNLDPSSTGTAVGKLDLTNNAMVIHNGNLAQITAAIGVGANQLSWNGSTGITSSTAAADTTHLTALGVIQNMNADGSAIYTTSFDGQTNLDLTSTDVLIHYTYYGDANLDGQVDGSDYSLIDNGFAEKSAGWQNGDFNYDGVVDGSDYTLIDNAFNQQGADSLAVVTAQIASVPEPAGMGMLALMCGMLGRPRRRVRRVGSAHRWAKPTLRGAFSLVELLVVVGIIALLIGILLPSLFKARQNAQLITCASNIRQLAMANLLYANDNHTFYVLAASDIFDDLGDGEGGHWRWHGYRAAAGQPFNPALGPLAPYLGTDGRVKNCPLFDPSIGAATGNNFEDGCGGYGYNEMYIGGRADLYGYCPDAVTTAAKVPQVLHAATTVMFTDAGIAQPFGNGVIVTEYSFCEPPWVQEDPGPLSTDQSWPSIHFRHHGQASVAWADGHVTAEHMTFSGESYGLSTRQVQTAGTGGVGWFGPDSNSLFQAVK
jgi:prepilin-type processing-associated H-X9-DG protein